MAFVINQDPKAIEAQWREFKQGMRAKIRPYMRSLVRKILRESTVTELIDIDGGVGAREKVDPALWDKHFYRHIIEDIAPVINTEGLPVVCTPEVIDLVCDQVDGFAAWAAAESQKMAEQLTASREKQEKNLPRSRGGKKTGPTA